MNIENFLNNEGKELIEEILSGTNKDALINLAFTHNSAVMQEYYGYDGDLGDIITNKLSKKRAALDLIPGSYFRRGKKMRAKDIKVSEEFENINGGDDYLSHKYFYLSIYLAYRVNLNNTQKPSLNIQYKYGTKYCLLTPCN